jgi:hypothetical protein
MSLDGEVKRSAKMLFQPKLEHIESEHCDHWFLPTASKEGFFEIQRFRWVRGSSGKLEGDPLFQEAALIRAFAALATGDEGKATDFFMMLEWQKSLRNELWVLAHDQKASAEVITDFLREAMDKRRKPIMTSDQ